jgi:hypothetical protein
VAGDDGDLRDVWCSAARRASDAQLVVCVGLAIGAALTFVIGALVDLQRALRWWPLILPGQFLGTFGLWGIADREIQEKREGRVSRRILVAVKWCSVFAAGIVGALAAIGVLRLTIGTWIS